MVGSETDSIVFPEVVESKKCHQTHLEILLCTIHRCTKAENASTNARCSPFLGETKEASLASRRNAVQSRCTVTICEGL